MNATVALVPQSPVPLYVDLDGTLVRSDLLIESALALFKKRPGSLWSMMRWLLKGKASLKAAIANEVELDIVHLPRNAEVVDLITRARAVGRRTILATASNEKYAKAVAEHLGLFDAVLASNAAVNRSGRSKLQAITADAAGPFDYVGNSSIDIPIWAKARRAIVVSNSAVLIAKARQGGNAEIISSPTPGLKTWIRALRLHQWAKNLLVFLPAASLVAVLGWTDVAQLILAFIGFGLCASAAYLLNDLLDLDADRQHPSKSKRPIPSGAIPLSLAVVLVPVLLLTAFAIAGLWLPWTFPVVLGIYWTLTMAYSIRFKRITVLDVLLLAGLYTLRILAGAAAIGVMPSFWILGFSMFLFFSLASAKRYIELHGAQKRRTSSLAGRGYDTNDLPLILAQGVAAGQIAVLVLALYIKDAESARHFRQLYYLWGTVPLLLYWISRLWIKVTRGLVQDDPLVFALTDRQSRYIALACGAFVYGAV